MLLPDRKNNSVYQKLLPTDRLQPTFCLFVQSEYRYVFVNVN
ncbi:unnamed protein product [Trichobilharzia regenti]|nr:unnamed protein product [Trichobilharzia regenti]